MSSICSKAASSMWLASDAMATGYFIHCYSPDHHAPVGEIEIEKEREGDGGSESRAGERKV